MNVWDIMNEKIFTFIPLSQIFQSKIYSKLLIRSHKKGKKITRKLGLQNIVFYQHRLNLLASKIGFWKDGLLVCLMKKFKILKLYRAVYFTSKNCKIINRRGKYYWRCCFYSESHTCPDFIWTKAILSISKLC